MFLLLLPQPSFRKGNKEEKAEVIRAGLKINDKSSYGVIHPNLKSLGKISI